MKEIKSRRTLRRMQKKEILKDYCSDLEKIQFKIDNAKTNKEEKAFVVLYEIIYKAYTEIIDSEV